MSHDPRKIGLRLALMGALFLCICAGLRWGRSPDRPVASNEGLIRLENRNSTSLTVKTPQAFLPRASGFKPVTEPVAPRDGCVDLRFRAASKEFVRYGKNRVVVADPRIDPESLCVRVDGTPVKFVFDPKKGEIVLGSVADVASALSVRYCFGKAKCSESCVVPRDEFMEALAGVDDETAENAPSVGWTGTKELPDEEKNLDRELASFRDVTDERLPGVYAQWSPASPVAACEAPAHTQTARAE